MTRTVTPAKLPQAGYALTALGASFLGPIRGLAGWVAANADEITAARAAYADSNTASVSASFYKPR